MAAEYYFCRNRSYINLTRLVIYFGMMFWRGEKQMIAIHHPGGTSSRQSLTSNLGMNDGTRGSSSLP
jgi:hypothetical protein